MRYWACVSGSEKCDCFAISKMATLINTIVETKRLYSSELLAFKLFWIIENDVSLPFISQPYSSVNPECSQPTQTLFEHWSTWWQIWPIIISPGFKPWVESYNTHVNPSKRASTQSVSRSHTARHELKVSVSTDPIGCSSVISLSPNWCVNPVALHEEHFSSVTWDHFGNEVDGHFS